MEPLRARLALLAERRDPTRSAVEGPVVTLECQATREAPGALTPQGTAAQVGVAAGPRTSTPGRLVAQAETEELREEEPAAGGQQRQTVARALAEPVVTARTAPS